jgi:Cu+-exporting ATPase
VIAIADPVKSSTAGALAALGQEKVRVVMLTGDNRTTVRRRADREQSDSRACRQQP